MSEKPVTRRQALGLAGASGAGLIVAGSAGALARAKSADSLIVHRAGSCVLTPAKTIGPYFVDEKLLRADIRTDTSDGTVEPGVLLGLQFDIVDVDNSCAPVTGAAVDVWHASAAGRYSDFQQEGALGEDFLRGLQVTDANGRAGFVTVFSGWYSGRTVHIHFRVRLFNGSTATYDFVSQIFFDQTLVNEIQESPQYTGAGSTTNAQDNIYGNDTEVLVTLTGSQAAGYFGGITVGLTGVPGSGGGDGAADASIDSVKFAHRKGGRLLKVKLDAGEDLTADAKLLRGRKLLGKEKDAAISSSKRKLAIEIGDKVEPGPAKLKVTVTDSAGNKKVLRKKVEIPGR